MQVDGLARVDRVGSQWSEGSFALCRQHGEAAVRVEYEHRALHASELVIRGFLVLLLRRRALDVEAGGNDLHGGRPADERAAELNAYAGGDVRSLPMRQTRRGNVHHHAVGTRQEVGFVQADCDRVAVHGRDGSLAVPGRCGLGLIGPLHVNDRSSEGD